MLIVGRRAEDYRGALSVSTTLAGSAPAFKYEELVSRCLGNFDLIEKVLETFERQFTADLSALDVAMDGGDATEIANLAHRMKGAACNVAAPALTQELVALEEAAGAANAYAISTAGQRIRAEWLRFLEHLG